MKCEDLFVWRDNDSDELDPLTPAEFDGIAREWMLDHPAEALRTLLFDVCEECGGSGHHDACEMDECKCGLVDDCLACGGSGRTPKPGVSTASVPYARTPDQIVIPASMLEGDS